MPRKLRLGVQRKYAFRKKRSDRIAPLVISIPRDLVQIYPLSLPIDAFLDSGCLSLSALKKRIKIKNALPSGILLVLYYII